MNMNHPASIQYPFPNDDGESERLGVQGAFFAPLSGGFLDLAGIGGSMRVLDIGCGTGEVTRLVADRLDENGMVVGIDQDTGRLQQAREITRTTPAKCRVTFEHCDLTKVASLGEFDAVVGRMLLLYIDDPVATLSSLQLVLKPNGILAIQEPDHSNYLVTMPESPLFATWRDRLMQTCQACNLRLNSGLHLRSWMERAGYEVTLVHLSERQDCGPDSTVYEVLARAVLGLRSKMLDNKVIGSADEAPADLANQLRKDAVQHQRTVFSSKLIGVVGRRS